MHFETVLLNIFFGSEPFLDNTAAAVATDRHLDRDKEYNSNSNNNNMWLLIPILLYTLIFLYIRHVYSYWERKGIPTERSGLNWCFLKQVYKRELHHVDAVCEAYRAGREQILGIYFFFRPTLLVRDMTLARTILENSYVHFNDTKWDYVRGYRKFNLLEKLAPIFTVARVEGMFRNIEKVADHMLNHLKTITLEADNPNVVDMQSILRIYSINIIGNLVYGLESNNFEQSDSIFSSYISNAFKSCAINSFTLNHLPKKSSLTYRLRDIIKESVESREEGGTIRKDVLQLLVKFRNGNNICNDSKKNWHIDNVFEREKVISINKLSKIAEDFLNMGLDTIASTTVLTLFEVLQEPSIHKKAFEEIHNLIKLKTVDNKQLSYADLEQFKYLDNCIQETLRKYPGVPIIERVCRKNFNIPNSRFTLSEGKTIMIPLLSLQRDEKYFAEPLSYKPERYLRNEDAKIKEACIGYGLGAGTCVAQNFAKLVIKMALVKLLINFKMELSADKTLELAHNPAPVIKSRDGLQVHLRNHEIKPNFYL